MKSMLNQRASGVAIKYPDNADEYSNLKLVDVTLDPLNIDPDLAKKELEDVFMGKASGFSILVNLLSTPNQALLDLMPLFCDERHVVNFVASAVGLSDDICKEILAPALEKIGNLVSLDLSLNDGITAVAIESLRGVFEKNLFLEEVFLKDNYNLGNKGLAKLTQHLVKDANQINLFQINLQGCGIEGQQGAALISLILAKMPNLEHVNFCDNHFGDEVVIKKIIPALMKIPNLQNFNFCDTGITDLGACCVLDALDKKASTVSSLDLSLGDITDVTIRRLIQSLEREDSVLENLDLNSICGEKVTEGAVIDLLRAIKKSESLQEVRMEDLSCASESICDLASEIVQGQQGLNIFVEYPPYSESELDSDDVTSYDVSGATASSNGTLDHAPPLGLDGVAHLNTGTEGVGEVGANKSVALRDLMLSDLSWREIQDGTLKIPKEHIKAFADSGSVVRLSADKDKSGRN